MTTLDPAAWYPIAAEHDVPPGHIYRTMLAGHELAAWRSGNGALHVWHDRCPHRGVHLSLGQVVGDELRCQYHAWRFGVTGRCTFIPAQPDRKVPGGIRATIWPVATGAGLVWTGIAPHGAPPLLPPGTVIRAVPISRPTEKVAAILADATQADAILAKYLQRLALVLQPLDDGAVIVRGIARDDDLTAADTALLSLRRRAEQAV